MFLKAKASRVCWFMLTEPEYNPRKEKRTFRFILAGETPSRNDRMVNVEWRTEAAPSLDSCIISFVRIRSKVRWILLSGTSPLVFSRVSHLALMDSRDWFAKTATLGENVAGCKTQEA
ncbi:hypothetical protein P9112_004064 [Eukaryota sp. TZLM1-RC]